MEDWVSVSFARRVLLGMVLVTNWALGQGVWRVVTCECWCPITRVTGARPRIAQSTPAPAPTQTIDVDIDSS